MSDDLVERVALAFCGKDVPCKMCRNDAKKAIAAALEEAARVAELAPYNRGGMVCGCSEGLSNWTAAAIRAMIPSGNDPAQNDDADSK
jgi:hypothetical protein